MTGEFRALGVHQIAVSPQTPRHCGEFAEEKGLSFPLLSDRGNEVARRYGLVHELPSDLRKLYRKVFDIDLPEYNGDDSWTLPIPARYVVGTDGVVKWAAVSADYTRRPDPADTLEALQKMTRSDES